MRPRTILILGNYANEYIIELLADLGFASLLSTNIERAVEKLRKEEFAAVIIDTEHAQSDVLEFVLNLRDISVSMPVIILGMLENKEVRWALSSQQRTTVIENTKNNRNLAEKMKKVFQQYNLYK